MEKVLSYTNFKKIFKGHTFLEVRVAAKYFGVANSRIYSLAKNNKVAHFRLGKNGTFVSKQDTLKYLNS